MPAGAAGSTAHGSTPEFDVAHVAGSLFDDFLIAQELAVVESMQLPPDATVSGSSSSAKAAVDVAASTMTIEPSTTVNAPIDCLNIKHL